MFDTLTQKFTSITSRLTGKRKLTEKNITEACGEVRRALIDADVNFRVVRDFVARVQEKALGLQAIPAVDPGQLFVKVVQDELEALLGPTDATVYFNPTGPTVILLAGLQGSGKTTTCAKLALYLKKKHGRHPLLVAADVQRPAAIKQLQVLGEQIETPVYAEPGGQPPVLCANAIDEAKRTGRDTLIIDTAGRLHIDEVLMQELADIRSRTQPHEIFLVVDAMVGQDAVNSAKEFNDRLEISGVILTKLDGDARGGAALSVKEVTGKTIKFVGVSEKLDGLEPFRPEGMAQRILGMGDIVALVEKAQENLDLEQQQVQLEKLTRGRFTLEDMLTQFEQVEKLGSFQSVIKMIPGASNLLGDEDIDEREILRLKAVIQSMTAAERERPEIIDNSRRKRIARGSGADPRDVSGLLKQHREMKRMMVGKGRFAGLLSTMFGGGGNGPQLQLPEGLGLPKPKKPKGPSRKEIRKRRKKGRRKR